MEELERALVADSAAAALSHILEGISKELAERKLAGASHTIYGEVWHVTFWQKITLDWVAGKETPVPEHAALGFPSSEDRTAEPWDELYLRFFAGLEQAAMVARETGRLDEAIRCPSPSGKPVRTMSVRDQLISLAAHNAYHFGRVVLLRQVFGAWPPASGGYTW